MSAVLVSEGLRNERAAAASDVAVRIESLSKRFVQRRGWAETLRHPMRTTYTTVLHGISCEIRSGEFFGLLGPNGAGKTTLFKTLSTSTIPDRGTAVVDGHDVIRHPAKVRRLVGCVMANDRSLHWRLTAADNLRLFAALHGLSSLETRSRVKEVLRVVDLHETGDKLVGTFSSGMKQRLLLARALLHHPKILLLDEPTRSLDPLSARSFRRFLRSEIVDRQKCTVLLATHNSEEAMELCDRVGVLHKGRLLAVGTTEELTRRFGDQLFCVWTRDPDHSVFAALAAQGRVEMVDVAPADAAGWSCVRMTILGGLDAAARVLELLTAAGVGIARFEHVNLSLADLIERVVASRSEAY